MNRSEDGKETIATMGEDLRERVSRTAEPVQQELEQYWDNAVSLMKKHPGKALGLAAIGGALAGVVVARLMTHTPSDAEKKVRHWVHNAQDSWGLLRDGLNRAVAGARGILSLSK